MENLLSSNPTIEENIQGLVTDAKVAVSRTYHKYERLAVASPGKAVLLALGAGYCLHRLPIRSLLVLQVRTAVALAPAVLLGLGAVKLCSMLQRPKKLIITSPTILRHAGEFHEGQ